MGANVDGDGSSVGAADGELTAASRGGSGDWSGELVIAMQKDLQPSGLDAPE